MRYPYSRPHLEKIDLDSVIGVLQEQYLTQGRVLEQLESALESLFLVKHAVVCNSGTAALHMAYDGIGLGPEAGLITSSVTFLATANAARMCNAPVAFADVDPKTGNVTLGSIQEAVAKAPFPIKAITIVHLGGRPCDEIDEISAFAESIGATLVEDACHAPLARYPDKVGKLFSVGNCAHSTVATMSFHAIKHITAGEGGVLLTNDDTLAEKARLLRSHGIIRDASSMHSRNAADQPWYYEMHELGFNYRLSEINCALAIHQIGRLKANISRRQKIARQYHIYLADMEHVSLPVIPEMAIGLHAWHLFALSIDFFAIKKTRGQVMHQLATHGIGSQVHYIPLYHQPYYSSGITRSLFPGAEKYYANTLSLPMYYGLDDSDIKLIAQGVRVVLSQ